MGGRAEAVDTGNGSDGDDVGAGEHCLQGGMTQSIYFIVNAGVFSNVGVGAGQISLGLVVVVIGNKLLDGVVGKKLLKLLG